MSTQLAFVLRDRDRAEFASVEFRKVCREVAEEIGIKVLGDDWDCGHATVSNKLDEEERRALKPAEIFDLAMRDPHGRIVAAFADLAGFERPERKRLLDAGEKLSRLEDALVGTLGKELAEVVRRKAGLK